MKQKYSICIFLALLLCVSLSVVWITGQVNRDTELTEDIIVQETEKTNDEETVYSSKTVDEYKYVIMDVDGHLTVFYSDNETVYFDTGIRSENLSDAVRSDLQCGIRFLTEEELYEFLENYSS